MPDDLMNCQFKMRVYARLYELENWVSPKEAVLYLQNELCFLKDKIECGEMPIRGLRNDVLSVSLEPGSEIDEAVAEFVKIVQNIEKARETDFWPENPPGKIRENDCTICDL